MLAAVFGDQGVDRSEAVDLLAMFSRPRSPFGQFFAQAGASLSDRLEDAFRTGFHSCGSVEPLLGLLALTPPGEAAVAVEFTECLLGGPSFLTGLAQVRDGVLLVFLERRQGVERWVGSSGEDWG